MEQTLDNFSKILLATGTINYMAASINSLNQQLKFSRLSDDPIHGEGIKEWDEILETIVKALAAIMEDMGNLINNHDALCEIDIRATTAAFEIVVHKKDNVDKDYSGLTVV